MANKYVGILSKHMARMFARALPSAMAEAAFTTLSGRLGVRTISADGDIGRFQGLPGDMGDHRVRGESRLDVEKYAESRRPVTRIEGKPLDSVLEADSLRGSVVIKVDTQGAILPGGRENEVELMTTKALIEDLRRRVPFDGSAARFFDLLLARIPLPPG